MRDVVTRTFFISAFHSDKDKGANLLAHNELGHALRMRGLNPVQVEGRYAGHDELSYAVSGGQALETQLMLDAMDAGQEAIMVVYHDMAAEIIYVTGPKVGNREIIGHLRRVDAVDNETAFSRINNSFWVVK